MAQLWPSGNVRAGSGVMFCYKKPSGKTLETLQTDHTYQTSGVAEVTFRGEQETGITWEKCENKVQMTQRVK